ncbi:MAG: aminotransferase class I/II-fold pyridoxal phosphate-dependent enzyme [Oscillospiraceae bacterium]|nr:aminotransferase class I/II-fold pyridoxal phosphate-dependent enzyme [Oscillospiraceae bacterium]
MDYEKLLCSRIKELKPSGIRRFFSVAAEMEDCISLGVGEPDFVTPWRIRDAGIRSLDSGKTWYTANAGLAVLREEICEYLNRRFGLHYEFDETFVTVGGSEGIDLCMRVLLEPGDEVILPTPSFVAYDACAHMCGAKVVPIATKAENSFRLTAGELKAAITPKTKLLVFPFPCNPTGAVMRRAHLEEIAKVLSGTDIIVLSDEIYAELTYGGERHVSIASISEDMRARTVIVNGFSKAYAMTGWRLGYLCGPRALIDQMLKLHQYALMCAPTMAQYGAITALRECDDSVEAMATEYNMRRRLIVDGFNRLGLSCFEPEGAFYSFPCIKSTGMKSLEFCEKLLESQRVALVPGDAFGASGEGFVRASYSYSVSHIAEALRRVGEFLKELKG